MKRFVGQSFPFKGKEYQIIKLLDNVDDLYEGMLFIQVSQTIRPYNCCLRETILNYSFRLVELHKFTNLGDNRFLGVTYYDKVDQKGYNAFWHDGVVNTKDHSCMVCFQIERKEK